MLNVTNAFSSFSVNDIEKAKSFYADTLGMNVSQENEMGFTIHVKENSIFVYPKKDHTPASFTVLNFVVNDIDEAVGKLKSDGVKFEEYSGDIKTDENGIMRGIKAGHGPDIAWFKDPAGNVLSILQEK